MNRMVKAVIFCQFVLFLNLSFAQDQMRFHNISRRDGLASGSITSIVQDQQGLIWIATKQGLNRYDGTEFIHYHAGNSKINSNDISELVVDKAGHLWIGTFGSGLYQLKSGTGEIVPFEHQDIGGRILSILLTSDASILVLSNLGVVRLDPSSGNEITRVSTDLTVDASSTVEWGGSVWIGTTDSELYRVDQNGSYVSYSMETNFPGMTIQEIYPIDDERLFIGTRQHGLWIFSLADESFTKVPIEAVDIRNIIQDRNGLFWIGTDGSGIFCKDGVTWNNYMHQINQENSLASNAVQTCFEDRDGNIWFGTAWDGISLFDRRLENLQFIYSDFEGTEASGVLSIYSENGQLWLGTDGAGLSVHRKEGTGTHATVEIPKDTYVHFIRKIGDNYWIGTFQSGFFLVEDKSNAHVTHFTISDGLSHDDVRDVEQVADHLYLIATWGGGLNLFNDETGRFRKLTVENGQPKDVVTLHKISPDEILVGTFGQGLFVFRYSDLKCTRLVEDIHNVVSIGANEEGIWLGTWGEGLHCTQYPFVSSELMVGHHLSANSNIFSILTTDDNVWLATSEQILKVSRDSAVMEVPLPPQQYHINAASRGSSGRLFFGGTEGVISFLPSDIDVTTDKLIQILEVKVLSRSLGAIQPSVSSTNLTELSHDQNLLTFSYATPTYPSSRDEMFEILLTPIHSDWINVGHQRSMTFADLNAGDYEFSVRNSSSRSEQSFKFRIGRPWWKTWWAYSLASCVFVGLLYSFRRFSINMERMKNQLEIEKIGREKDVEIGHIKQRFFVNISHEIRTPLTLIIGEIEQLAVKVGGSKSVTNSLNSLRSNGNHLIQLVNELLDFRKLDQGGMRLKVGEGNFVKFCREIYLSFTNKSEEQSINFEFSANMPSIEVWYDRDQLEKVFFNLLSNAFKNTPAGGTIRFQINLTSDGIEAVIEDTGKGIPQKELETVFKRFYQKENDLDDSRQGFGIGLSIVQEIIRLHHGDVAVESEAGKGSKFIVKLKSGNDHFEEVDLIPEFTNSESLVGYSSSDIDTIETGQNLRKEAEIMVVEDNEEIRKFLVRTLSPRFKVHEASDGKEAYELVVDLLPDLIISDVMMPEMDGITLTKMLKRNPITSHIPIILLTARTGTVFKKEGYETGADDFITKPFNSAILMVRIENILRARNVLTEQIRNELAIRPDDLNLATPDEQFLKNLVQVVHRNLDNSELNAEMVGTEMRMSHSVVYKKLKALTGFGLVEFIRDYRLQQASEILGKYKFTVAEACYKVGYSDKKYFSQIFKKKFGVSPSEYAKNQP